MIAMAEKTAGRTDRIVTRRFSSAAEADRHDLAAAR
jgi:hypothetical protein